MLDGSSYGNKQKKFGKKLFFLLLESHCRKEQDPDPYGSKVLDPGPPQNVMVLMKNSVIVQKRGRRGGARTIPTCRERRRTPWRTPRRTRPQTEKVSSLFPCFKYQRVYLFEYRCGSILLPIRTSCIIIHVRKSEK